MCSCQLSSEQKDTFSCLICFVSLKLNKKEEAPVAIFLITTVHLLHDNLYSEYYYILYTLYNFVEPTVTLSEEQNKLFFSNILGVDGDDTIIQINVITLLKMPPTCCFIMLELALVGISLALLMVSLQEVMYISMILVSEGASRLS